MTWRNVCLFVIWNSNRIHETSKIVHGEGKRLHHQPTTITVPLAHIRFDVWPMRCWKNFRTFKIETMRSMFMKRHRRLQTRWVCNHTKYTWPHVVTGVDNPLPAWNPLPPFVCVCVHYTTLNSGISSPTQDSFIPDPPFINFELQVHTEYMFYEEICICPGWKLSIFCDGWQFRCLQWENGSKFQFVLGGKKFFADPPVYSNPPAY